MLKGADVDVVLLFVAMTGEAKAGAARLASQRTQVKERIVQR